VRSEEIAIMGKPAPVSIPDEVDDAHIRTDGTIQCNLPADCA
jgi:hypothetical protein